MSETINPTDVFSRLEGLEDISGLPLVISDGGRNCIVMTIDMVIFIEHDKEAAKSHVGVHCSERGAQTLIGFGVQPKMVPVDHQRADLMIRRLIEQKEKTERDFMNFKADQEIFKLEVWHSLGSSITSHIRNSAGWLSDFIAEHPDKVNADILARVGRITAIMDHILNEGRKDRRRKSVSL